MKARRKVAARNVRAKRSARVLPTAKRQSLKAQAFERIRFDIVTYVLKPGDKISEADLRRRYGVGHAPVRSALQRLVEQGLVLNLRRRGHAVAPIALRDIREIFQLRRILEPVAVELATPRFTAEQKAELRALARVRFDYRSEDRERKAQFLMANRAFCVAFARACGNDRLCASIEHLQDLMLRILYLGLHAGASGDDEGFVANAATFDAVLAGNARGARDLYATSLERSEQWILRSLVELPSLQHLNVAT